MFGIGQYESTIIVVYVVLAIATGVLANSKGRSGAGWGILAFLLTPLVIIIVMCLGKIEKQHTESPRIKKIESNIFRSCPYCAESIKREAILCKHCGKESDSLPELDMIVCPRCGHSIPFEDEDCAYCLMRIDHDKIRSS